MRCPCALSRNPGTSSCNTVGVAIRGPGGSSEPGGYTGGRAAAYERVADEIAWEAEQRDAPQRQFFGEGRRASRIVGTVKAPRVHADRKAPATRRGAWWPDLSDTSCHERRRGTDSTGA